MKKILEHAKKLSIPSKSLEQQQSKIAKLVFSLVRKEASKFSQIRGVEFAGSYAKGTWLPQKADVDIFVKFDKSTSEKKFVITAKKIGFNAMKKFNPYVRYSDHPYVEAKIKGIKVNIVPCYDVENGKWQSAADRSPFHTNYMLESLTGAMKNEVRLLKLFLISNKIYGSEIARQGISGYVAEVLTLHYGNFQNVMENIANLKPNHMIGKASKKFDTSLIIMDPIDSNRNLATAISIENLGKFILACRMFLERPSITFFKKRKLTSSRKNLENLLVVSFNYKPRSPDIIWGQIKKASKSIAIQLQKEGFNILRNSAATDEKNHAWLLFLIQSLKISEDHVREGPDFFFKDDSKKFIQKNAKKSKIMWISNDRKILSLQKRNYSDSKLFLQNLLKNNLNKTGIPKGLKHDFKKGFTVTVAKKAKGKSIKEAISEIVSTDAKIFYSY